MALDPSVRKLLQMLENLRVSNFNSMDVGQLRRMMDASPLPHEQIFVKKVEDISIALGDRKLPARLYIPDETCRSLIIYFHGGGFVFGNLDTHDAICRLASSESGCKVLSIDYRLAPENKFPAAAEDAYSSFLWAEENSFSLGIMEDSIALAGDSAGGNLAAVACLMLKDKGQKLPRLQVLFYPPIGADLYSESMREYGNGYLISREQLKWFGDMYLRDDRDALNPYFSPIMHPDLSGLPEAIVVTAEHDPLRDQAETYVSLLRSAGVQATGIRSLGMIHGFLSTASLIGPARDTALMVWKLVGMKIGRH